MARVILDRSGRWHVSFTAPQPTLERKPTGRGVGLDAVVATLADSDGVFHQAPAEQHRLRWSERRLAHRQKGSLRWAKTKAAVPRLRATETGRRRDWIEKTITSPVCSIDVIAIEDLAVKNMVRSGEGTDETRTLPVAA